MEEAELGKIHYTQLQPSDWPDPEWDTYRREVGRLLAEGHEGRWALIKGDQVFGVFDTPDEAEAAGIQRFLCTAFLVRQIHTFEPVRPFPNLWM
jgi:hypothetical protein